MSEITNAQVSQALRQAKARIVKYGWVQGEYGRKDDGYCMAGACQGSDLSPEMSVLRAVVDDLLCNWNDAPERTLEDVLSAFDAAIDLVEGRTE